MSALPGYSNIHRLGSGGLGDVFYAVKDSTRTEVAIKVLRDWSDRSAAWQRAGREFHALRQLQNHPHVVTLLDVEVANGVPHLVMEFASGGSVNDVVTRRGAGLTIGEVVLVGSHTAAALAAAHAVGIVHLDIKPQNLLITRFGDVKVCDFGIAALTGSERYREQTNSITYRYASPEQLAERDAGAPSDVFSLGLTLAHLLTGPTWTRGAQDSLGAAAPAWPRPDGIDSAVATHLDALVAACLQPDPAARPTASSLLAQFDGLAARLGERRVRQLERVPPPLGPAVVARPTPPSSPRPAPSGSRPPAATGGRRTPTGPRTGGRGTTTGDRRGATTGARKRARPPRRRSGGTALAIGATVVLAGVIAAGALLIPRLARKDDPTSAARTPPVTAAVDEAAALGALDALVATDAASVEQLVGRWVPQIGSGRPGPEPPGTATAAALLASVERLRGRFDAVVFTTGEYAGPEDGMYVVVVPRPMDSADEALTWCRGTGFPADDCAARLVTRDDTVDPVVVYQS